MDNLISFYIRLIVRPGVFLYYVHQLDNSIHFTTDKENATGFSTRDEAINMIKQIFDLTNWKFNLEINTY